MSSTYLELCQKLRQEVGAIGTGPSTVTSQTGMYAKIVAWVADADIAIQTKWLDWGFLHGEFEDDTIANIKDISAPSDFGMWDKESFYLDYTSDDYKHLEPLDYFEWRNSLRLGTQTADEPDFIIIKPNKDLVLHPIPDGVYTLTADYYKTATRMTGNTDTSLIPTKFDRLIITQAKMYYAEHENAPEVMQAAFNEYNELMNRFESLYLPGQLARTKSWNNDMVTVVE